MQVGGQPVMSSVNARRVLEPDGRRGFLGGFGVLESAVPDVRTPPQLHLILGSVRGISDVCLGLVIRIGWPKVSKRPVLDIC